MGHTFHRPLLARMISSVSASISGSDLKCDLRFLSTKARETASCPFTLATSPEIKKIKNGKPHWFNRIDN